MTTRLEAIFENGVLKPIQPITLAEGRRVHITLALEEPKEFAASKPARFSWERMPFAHPQRKQAFQMKSFASETRNRFSRRFVDTSALTKRYHYEPDSLDVWNCLSFDDEILISQITPLEVRSAFYGMSNSSPALVNARTSSL